MLLCCCPRTIRPQALQVLSKHDEQQRRLQQVMAFDFISSTTLTSLSPCPPPVPLTFLDFFSVPFSFAFSPQLRDEVRTIERRLRDAQAAVAEQEAAMRADEGERHRAELRRQEYSRQWAKDDDKLAALQRSIQASLENFPKPSFLLPRSLLLPSTSLCASHAADFLCRPQNMASAQVDFESLFVSLKSQAQAGARHAAVANAGCS